MGIIERSFYLNNTVDVAQNLLGCILCRRSGDKVFRGQIVETEAYTQEDPSCHAFRGETARNSVMFYSGGYLYVYFTYGMHYCMNIVTEEEGRGCAVLIRAIEPLGDFSNTNGPAKLCKVLNITKELNGTDLTDKNSILWLEYGTTPQDIIITRRIGIKQAIDYPWRFYIKNNPWVSKRKPTEIKK